MKTLPSNIEYHEVSWALKGLLCTVLLVGVLAGCDSGEKNRTKPIGRLNRNLILESAVMTPEVQSRVNQLRQEIFQIKKAAFFEYIKKELIRKKAREASQEEKEVFQLFDRLDEIPVTDEEIKLFKKQSGDTFVSEEDKERIKQSRKKKAQVKLIQDWMKRENIEFFLSLSKNGVICTSFEEE